MSNIKINVSSANTVYLTLYEKTTVVNPTYLFNFVNASAEGVVKNFIAIDTQTYALLVDGARNKFTITEVASGAENLLTGSVHLAPTGQWNYKIYAQSSTTNVDPTLATELVEEGICFVYGTDAPTFNKYEDQPAITKYYTPTE